MEARTNGAEDVTAVELSGGEEIEGSSEKTDPCGAADRVKQERARSLAGTKESREEMEQQGSAKNDFGVGWICDAGYDLGVEETKDERGNGKDKTDQRAGGADVEESASGANGRTHEDEGAKSTDERREGNEERIAGVDAMMAAGEKMAELMGQENGQESGREGKAGKKGYGIFVEQRESAEEFVERDGLIVSIGGGELRAGGEAGAQCKEKKRYGQEEGFERRTREDRDIILSRRWKSPPIRLCWKSIESVV